MKKQSEHIDLFIVVGRLCVKRSSSTLYTLKDMKSKHKFQSLYGLDGTSREFDNC